MLATGYAVLHRPIAPGDPTPRTPDEPVAPPGPGPDPGPGDPQPVRAAQWDDPSDEVDALIHQFEVL